MSEVGRVALLGAGVAGAGWAARFAVNGIDVRVHDPDPRARDRIDETQEDATRAYARLFGADGDTVYFQHMTNGEPLTVSDVDTLVLAQGHRRVATLHEQLEHAGQRGLHIIGDALSPRTAEEAVLEGLEIAVALSA